MEHATVKPSKRSSNISETVSKFAKVCRLRSIGVIPSENPNQSQHPSQSCEDAWDKPKGVEPDGGDSKPSKGNVHRDVEISNLFEVVSALKWAYVQLQQAHIPYDPDKILATDKVVVAQLESLCRIKREYKAQQLTKAKLYSSRLGCLKKEIEVNERRLEKLKSQAKQKDSEIYNLGHQLEDLNVENRKLAEKLRQNTLDRENLRAVSNVSAFEDAIRAASKSIHDFGKPLVSLMKASGWELNKAANSVVDSVAYSKRSDKKYAFEAYIARRMFHGISVQSYNVDDVMRFDDPVDALMANPNSEFAKFCREKYLLVVHPLMEASFFGNFDQRNFVLGGRHPRTPFYEIFAKMAKWVWILQGISASLDPKARIFIVERGSKFSDVYMESVEDRDGLVLPNEGQPTRGVEFMIMPGFRIGDSVVKSRVYLSKTK